MEFIPASLSNKWLKASVIGSIWAANEIILGSFLHNIRIPFTGAIMAFISIGILVSFCELWKESGIVVRSALIAALMKSISPSAIILGPMIGIMLEGLLLGLGIILLGRNLAGYILGGSLAVMSVLFQKVGMLIVRYGLDFIEIINNMFLYSAEQLNFSPDKGIILIVILVGIHAIAGTLGAITGFIIGRNAKKMEAGGIKDQPSSGIAHLFDQSEKRSYSLYLLALHLIILVMGMYLINTGPVYFIVPFILIYMLFVIFQYKSAVRRLKKPSFWIWFVIITFLASYFLGSQDTGGRFNIGGLQEGLLMNLRAVLVVMSFAAISTELKNPLVKTIMYKRGAAQLYQGLELAFGILPNIMAYLPDSKSIFRNPFRNLTILIARSDEFLDLIEKQKSLQSKVLIITGGIQEGKTTTLRKAITGLDTDKINIEGFFSEVVKIEDERTGYRLVPLNGQPAKILCSREPGQGKIKYGKFYFNHEAVDLGRNLLMEAKNKPDSLVIIDEIGPLEMSGKGWSDAVESLCSGTGIPMIWVVRKNLAEKAARKWSLGDTWIIDINEEDSMQKIRKVIADLIP